MVEMVAEILEMDTKAEAGHSDELERSLRTLRREDELLNKPISEVKELGGGANKSFLVDFEGGGSGVFKPKKGERPLVPFTSRTGYQKERAAVLVDRLIGLNLVPPTIIREINGDVGSLQEFIPDAEAIFHIEQDKIEDEKEKRHPSGVWDLISDSKELSEISKGVKDELNEKYGDQLYGIWILDKIIWSSDRHGGNMLTKDGKLFAIDNGESFKHIEFYPYDNYFNQPAPKDLIEKLDSFCKDESRKGILEKFLNELLSERQIRKCMSRIETVTEILKEKGMIPATDKVKYNGKLK